MARTRNTHGTKNAVVKNFTIGALTFLLLLGSTGVNKSAAAAPDTDISATQEEVITTEVEFEETLVENTETETEEVVEEAEPEVIIEYRDREVEKIVEKEVKVPYEVEKVVNHTYTSKLTAPTCTVAGQIVYSCDSCDDSYVETVPATGHSYYVASTNPVEGGANVTFQCSNCGTSYDKFVAAGEAEQHEHNYAVVERVDATCSKEGYVVNACECGSTYTETLDMVDHDWSNWSIVEEATTEKNAVEGRTCTACGKQETRDVEGTIIVPEVHECDFAVVEEVAATCEANGYIVYACECGETKTEENGIATGHDFCEWHKTFDLRSEVETRECENCGKQETRESEVHVHDYKVVPGTAVAATCDANGKEADQACECGDVIVGKEIVSEGHVYDVVAGTSKAATCTETGKESDKKCEVCGDVIVGADIAASGHNYEVQEHVDADCENCGKHVEKCANCGDVQESATEATGHSFGNYVYNNDASYEADGTETATCANCGKTDTRTAEGTKLVDWKALTYVAIEEGNWCYYTDPSGEYVCASPAKCKSDLAIMYPELTVCWDEYGIWVE